MSSYESPAVPDNEDLPDKISRLQERLTAQGVRLVGVTKQRPLSLLERAWQAGLTDMGENRVQELEVRRPALPEVRWHMIGSLQSNKVKYIAPYVHLIHSVDNMSLLKEIHTRARLNGRIIPCLLQVRIAREDTKHGLTEAALEQLLAHSLISSLSHIRVVGLMGMATFTEDHQVVREEFRGLRRLFEALGRAALPPNVSMQTLSMGMSQDYEIAIEEGTTMVRIGTGLFGPVPHG